MKRWSDAEGTWKSAGLHRLGRCSQNKKYLAGIHIYADKSSTTRALLRAVFDDCKRSGDAHVHESEYNELMLRVSQPSLDLLC